MRDPLRNLSAAQCVGASIKVVADRWPYIGHLLYRIRLYERPGLGTVSLDRGLRLHYDPVVVMGELQQMRFTPTIVAHEPWHKLLDHETREATHAARGWAARYDAVRDIIAQRDPNAGPHFHDLWNLCGDYEINGIMDAAGWEWPHAHTPVRFADHKLDEKWRAEQAVEWFVERAEQEEQEQAAHPGKGGGSAENGEGECPKAGKGAKDGDGQSQQGGAQGVGVSSADGEVGASGAGGSGTPPAPHGEDAVAPPHQPDDGGAGGGQGDGDADGDDSGADGDGASEDAADEADGGGGGNAHGAPDPCRIGGGKCGGCTGHDEPWEDANDADAPDPMTEDEVAIVRQRVAEDTVEYASSHGAGYGIGNAVLAWARDYLKPPKVDWRHHFSRETRSAVAGALGECGARKYDRPSRRREVMSRLGWGKRAPILPVHHREMPQVFVVGDSSGSMGSGQRSRFNRLLSETSGLLLQARADVWALSVDSGVQAVVKVRRATDLEKLCKGGGGTDIMPGVREALKPEYRTDVLVILTDGELYGGGKFGGWPAPEDVPPRVRVVVGIINQNRAAFDRVPKHLKAHAVHIHEED